MSNKNFTCLFIGHVTPYPSRAGNELRIAKLIDWLKSHGNRVILLLNENRLTEAQREILSRRVDNYFLLNDPEITVADTGKRQLETRDLVIAEQIVASLKEKNNKTKEWLCNRNLIDAAIRMRDKFKPDLVVAEYIFTAPLLDLFPQETIKMVDTHDMFSRKLENVVKFGAEEKLACTEAEERDYLLKSDVVIAIQQNEAKLFKKLVPEKTVITVGIDFETQRLNGKHSGSSNLILAVGSDNPLNIHGITEFIKYSWPLIRKSDPNAILRIVGSLSLAIDAEGAGIECAGIVDHISREYQEAAVVINPVIAGTGLKIKTIEALVHGKPLVLWPNGAEGVIFDDGPPFVICNSWKEFAGKIVELLQDQGLRFCLQKKAVNHAKHSFGEEDVYRELQEYLNSVLQTLPLNERGEGQENLNNRRMCP